MKKALNFILLSAGIILSLTGCQKGTEAENSDRIVRFSASTGVATRTVYSGEVTNNKERIDWVAGDKIVIWSDNATVRPEGTPKIAGNNNLAEYVIANVRADGEKSVANIEDPAGNGLQFPVDNPTGSTFWGIYPASAVKATPTNNSVPFKIEAEQAIEKNTVTTTANNYVPDMEQAVLVAYVSGAKAGTAVDLPFYPAYTDFEFNITTKLTAPITIEAMEIVSEGTNPTAMAGDFTATCTNGTWAYTIAEKATNSVKAILPNGGLTIDTDNPTLSLNVFALPQDLTNLRVIFYTSEGTKSLKLTEADKTTPISFAGTKKHVIDGLLLPIGWFFKYIDLDLKVLEWEAVDIDGVSAEFPQATQFAVSGEGVKNGYTDINHSTGDKDPYRQQWYFQTGQTATVFFKVMLPVNGTWKLEPVGGTEENPGTLDSGFQFKNVYTEATGDAALTGAIGSDGNTSVKIEITYTGSGQASFFFHSYVISNGEQINIDSETQIYDRGRGYHTFFVNSPLYNN